MTVPTGGRTALGLVSVGFVLAEILVVTPGIYLSWDEALYVSQFSTSVPAMGLDPHRSLGVALLVAPAAAVTASVPAIRVYLSVLAGAALFAAYRPWTALWDGRGVALAALLFAGLAVTLTNGNAALPNLAVALGAVAAVGLFAAAILEGGRGARVTALAAVLAGLALVRPTDAVWVAAPLLGATIAVPAWRRRGMAPAAAVLAGLAAGGVVWLVEAFARHGGPLRRLALLREVTDAGSHFVVVSQIAAAGRGLLSGDPRKVGGLLLGSALLAALLVALWTARGTATGAAWTLGAATAVAVGGPYLVLLSYPSQRYLLPVVALLTLPIAGGVQRMLASASSATRHATGRGRARAATALVVALLCAHVGSQLWLARSAAQGSAAARAPTRLAALRLEALGIRPPCLVSGSFAPQIAYAARCASGDMALDARRASVAIGSWRERHPETVPELIARDVRAARQDGRRLVVVARTADRPPHLAGWPRARLLPDLPWYAYVPPGDAPGKTGDAPGKTGDSAAVPGDSAAVPGDSAAVPGDSAAVPGDSAAVPGDSTRNRTTSLRAAPAPMRPARRFRRPRDRDGAGHRAL